MLRKTLFASLVLAAIVFGLAFGRTTAAPEVDRTHFRAILSGSNEVPANSSTGSGEAEVVFDSSAGILEWNLSVDNMTGITAAHIHAGLPGENGGVVFPLYTGTVMFDSTHPISGTLTVSPDQATALAAGEYYVNVHTEINPGGEIRGQLVQQFILFLPALFNAAQE